MVSEPICVASDIGDANETARWSVERLAAYELFHRGAPSLRLHVEVEHFFPHRRRKTNVALLPQVFLRDLQLDCLIRLFQTSEEWRGGLAHLKVDRPVLDLD